MARLDPVIVMLISLVLRMALVQSQDGPNKVNWATRVDNQNEVVTTLQFYFHDTLSGKNPSVVRVAQAVTTNNSSTLFGLVAMADDPLTEGPDPSSKLVGRAQGLYGSASQTELAFILAMNFGFLDGIYNSSSISLDGLDSTSVPVREIAVVGGTGVFRFARGYATAKTYSVNFTTGDAIVGYNVTVVTTKF